MTMRNQDVDLWVKELGEEDASELLHGRIPNARSRLKRLDDQICKVLSDIRKEFPDAQYYTASGGFNLLLGGSHDGNGVPQHQRIAWSGKARIGDGDF